MKKGYTKKNGIRRKGRRRYSWMQEVTTGMREKRINRMEWIDREE